MSDRLDRLKVLISSSTPIVVMETAEEMRAVNMVRAACSELNMATFEWSIADGLMRSGSNSADKVPKSHADPLTPMRNQNSRNVRTVLSPGSGEAERFTRTVMASMGADAAAAGAAGSIYNTREPVQALANMEAMTVEAAFILKDFHRRMEDAVVVRRLRDVGQKFSTNRKTVVITGPEITVPPELATLVEYFDLPLPDSRAPARHRSRHFHAPLEDLHFEARARCSRS